MIKIKLNNVYSLVCMKIFGVWDVNVYKNIIFAIILFYFAHNVRVYWTPDIIIHSCTRVNYTHICEPLRNDALLIKNDIDGQPIIWLQAKINGRKTLIISIFNILELRARDDIWEPALWMRSLSLCIRRCSWIAYARRRL